MNWLLDTNIASELMKENPDENVLTWLRKREHDCYLSSVTIAELRYGIERLPSGKRRREFEREFAFLLEDYKGRFFDFDGNIATEWGRYAALLESKFGEGWHEQFDYRDMMIAATAREYSLGLVTRNVKHFPFVETVKNPFEPAK